MTTKAEAIASVVDYFNGGTTKQAAINTVNSYTAPLQAAAEAARIWGTGKAAGMYFLGVDTTGKGNYWGSPTSQTTYDDMTDTYSINKDWLIARLVSSSRASKAEDMTAQINAPVTTLSAPTAIISKAPALPSNIILLIAGVIVGIIIIFVRRK